MRWELEHACKEVHAAERYWAMKAVKARAIVWKRSLYYSQKTWISQISQICKRNIFCLALWKVFWKGWKSILLYVIRLWISKHDYLFLFFKHKTSTFMAFQDFTSTLNLQWISNVTQLCCYRNTEMKSSR